MTEITDGLGSMSAMLIIISIIAIGAVMALRNKMANKKLRLSQMEQPREDPRPETSEPEQSSTDVDKILDDMKKDVED